MQGEDQKDLYILFTLILSDSLK